MSLSCEVCSPFQNKQLLIFGNAGSDLILRWAVQIVIAGPGEVWLEPVVDISFCATCSFVGSRSTTQCFLFGPLFSLMDLWYFSFVDVLLSQSLSDELDFQWILGYLISTD